MEGLTLSDGSWCTDPITLRFEAMHYFQNHFAPNSPVETQPLLLEEYIPLPLDGVNSLLAPVTKDEVFFALRSMKSFKAPGPDGFQPFFFKNYWDIVGDDVWSLVKNAFENGHFDNKISETYVVLISKIDHPKKLSQYRPISLCNVVYKLIT